MYTFYEWCRRSMYVIIPVYLVIRIYVLGLKGRMTLSAFGSPLDEDRVSCLFMRRSCILITKTIELRLISSESYVLHYYICYGFLCMQELVQCFLFKKRHWLTSKRYQDPCDIVCWYATIIVPSYLNLHFSKPPKLHALRTEHTSLFISSQPNHAARF